MTVSAVFRLWMHSTTPEDVNLLTCVISELLNPHRSATLKYRSLHPIKRDIFGQISSAFLNLHDKFFTTFVSRMLWLSFDDLPRYMEFLLNIYHIGRISHSPAYTAFIHTAFRCHTLWSNSFSLLRLVAQRRERLDENCTRICQAILGNAAFCIQNVQSEQYPCQQLVQDWAIFDLFGALDDILPMTLHSSYFTGLSPFPLAFF